jgi:membrane-bound lytic murein transglycosylase F
MNRYIHAALLSCAIAGCRTCPAPVPPPDALFPHERIEERGIIDVCMYQNATDYYLYQGIPRGFQHELLEDFTRRMSFDLHVDLNANFDEALDGLVNDHYDLVAMNICVTAERAARVAFTDPLFHTRWVIVQSKHHPRLETLEQLAGREIYHHPGSEGRRVLERLRDTLRVPFRVTEGPPHEELLLRLERGEIALAIMTEHVARGAPDLDRTLLLPGRHPVAWAVPRAATYLLADLNAWLREITANGQLAALRARYLTYPFPASRTRRAHRHISPYDTIIKENARLIGWDWRLLAALIHKESRFQPEAISPFGAVGLMQVMPGTAIRLGHPSYLSPRDNIRAGIAYIGHLQQLFARYPLDPDERTKFILAAYNAGPGHLLDAMRLAEAHDHDPYTWDDNVEYFLLNKSRPEYYRHPLVRHGYCDGKQARDFVNDILATYHHYKNIIPR